MFFQVLLLEIPEYSNTHKEHIADAKLFQCLYMSTFIESYLDCIRKTIHVKNTSAIMLNNSNSVALKPPFRYLHNIIL